MELACPHCEQRFSVSAAQAGKFRVLCPRCADSFGVRLEGDGMLRATRFRLDPKHHDIPSLNPGESRSQGTLDVSLHGAEVLARGDLAHDDEAARKTVDFATPNESIRVRTGKSSTPPAHDELSTMGTLDPSQWTAPARVRKGKEA